MIQNMTIRQPRTFECRGVVGSLGRTVTDSVPPVTVFMNYDDSGAPIISCPHLNSEGYCTAARTVKNEYYFGGGNRDKESPENENQSRAISQIAYADPSKALLALGLMVAVIVGITEMAYKNRPCPYSAQPKHEPLTP